VRKILPPTYFFACLIISVVLHYTLYSIEIIHYPFNLTGFLFFVLGTGLNIWPDQQLKKEKTTVKPFEKPSALIQTGAYKISRNPMYLGMSLLLMGAGFILGSIASFVGTIIFIASMEIIFIPEEERNMKMQFGEEFETYKKRVRRWL